MPPKPSAPSASGPAPNSATAAVGHGATAAGHHPPQRTVPTSKYEMSVDELRRGVLQNADGIGAVRSAVDLLVDTATTAYIDGVYDRLALQYTALALWDDMTNIVATAAISRGGEPAALVASQHNSFAGAAASQASESPGRTILAAAASPAASGSIGGTPALRIYTPPPVSNTSFTSPLLPPTTWEPGVAPTRIPADLGCRNVVPLSYKQRKEAAIAAGPMSATNLRAHRRRSNAPNLTASLLTTSAGTDKNSNASPRPGTAGGSQHSTDSPVPSSNALDATQKPRQSVRHSTSRAGGARNGRNSRAQTPRQGEDDKDIPSTSAAAASAVPPPPAEPTAEEQAFARDVAEQKTRRAELVKLTQSLTQQIHDMCKGPSGGVERLVVDATAGRVISIVPQEEVAQKILANDVPLKYSVPTAPSAAQQLALAQAAAAAASPRSAGRAGGVSAPSAMTRQEKEAAAAAAASARRPREEGFFQPEANTVAMVTAVTPTGGVAVKEGDAPTKRADLKLPKSKVTRAEFRNLQTAAVAQTQAIHSSEAQQATATPGSGGAPSAPGSTVGPGGAMETAPPAAALPRGSIPAPPQTARTSTAPARGGGDGKPVFSSKTPRGTTPAGGGQSASPLPIRRVEPAGAASPHRAMREEAARVKSRMSQPGSALSAPRSARGTAKDGGRLVTPLAANGLAAIDAFGTVHGGGLDE